MKSRLVSNMSVAYIAGVSNQANHSMYSDQKLLTTIYETERLLGQVSTSNDHRQLRSLTTSCT